MEQVQSQELGGSDAVDNDAAEMMGIALEPSTWKGRATHMSAVRVFMELKERDFPLEERDLVAILLYLFSYVITGSGRRFVPRHCRDICWSSA